MLHLGLLVAVASLAQAPGADTAWIPPAAGAASFRETQSAIPDDTLQKYLVHIGQVHFFDTFEGQNAALKSRANRSKGNYVADGFQVDLSDGDLFGNPFSDNSGDVYVSAITSVDAFALRLRADLSQLRPRDEAFVVDLNANRAFGPYTAADALPGGAWLATTTGDTCALIVRTALGDAPTIAVQAVSHFYVDLNEQSKALSCNNDIECESSQDIQESSSAIGMLVVPTGSAFQILCSGSLINNADTAEFEPYFLTSWHCVPDVVNANQVEVIWDWRTDTCGGNDAPTIATLPRSDGASVLRTSSTYDITLMSLDSVPVGDFGRAYLGWETGAPIANEDVVTLHFAGGTPMRISYGTVVSINQSSGGFSRQTKVHWDDGVTEGGSSGGPLLLADANYRICGTLSNGPNHSCTNIPGNVDWYSSFRDFFPSIEDFLTGDEPPGPDPGTGGVSCAAAKAFADNPAILDDLRAFRDRVLEKSVLGAWLVDGYYATAPVSAAVVDNSSAARTAFRSIAIPVAAAGRFLRE